VTLTIEAPTDAQLDFIRSLCRNAEQPLPDVIYSKTEATAIIDALKSGRYDWRNYCYDREPF
jgi:hypothetical protein